MECKVNQIVELGKNGGAGNLIICEIILMHISQSILNNKNQVVYKYFSNDVLGYSPNMNNPLGFIYEVCK